MYKVYVWELVKQTGRTGDELVKFSSNHATACEAAAQEDFVNPKMRHKPISVSRQKESQNEVSSSSSSHSKLYARPLCPSNISRPMEKVLMFVSFESFRG